jgi:hypothetical protein
LIWAPDGYLYFCGGFPATKVLAGHSVYRIDPANESHEYEWVGFGIEDDTLSLSKGADGAVLVKVAHRLESRVCLLDGTVLYSRKEELEAFDAAIDTEGKYVL